MKAFLEWSTDYLGQAGINLPRMEAEILIAAGLRFCRKEIYLRPEQILTENEKSILRGLIDRRICHEPIAYILGHKEFWSLDFKSIPGVLIPRPETETLVETLLLLIGETSKRQSLNLLDIGTGSGIIAIVVAKEIVNCLVTATDYSAKALAVARVNAEKHGVSEKINFIKCDRFAGLPQESYDFIVSNPPYIKTKDLDNLMPDVRDFEPRYALDGGLDGLDFYRCIVPGTLGYLKEGGRLLLEIGETQAEEVISLLCVEDKFEAIEVIQDGGGYDRVLSARKRANG